jgi:hypothetical protein
VPFSQLFFIRFEVNLSEYGSYSLHIRMFRYIHKHHLFASFASCSLHIRTNLNTNSRFVAKQINFLILANTCFKIFVLKRIFAKTNKFSQTGKYLLQNIRFEANIRKSLSKFYMQANIRLNSLANIRLQIFAYERIALANISILANFHYVLLQILKGKPFTILSFN